MLLNTNNDNTTGEQSADEDQHAPPSYTMLFQHKKHVSCQCKDKGFCDSIPLKKKYRSSSIMRMMNFIKEEEDKRQKAMQKKRDLYAKYNIQTKNKSSTTALNKKTDETTMQYNSPVQQ